MNCNLQQHYFDHHTTECFSFVVIKPEYYQYVFMKSEKPITGVSISEPGGIEEEIVDFDTNDQQLVPYKSIQNLLVNGDIHLI